MFASLCDSNTMNVNLGVNTQEIKPHGKPSRSGITLRYLLPGDPDRMGGGWRVAAHRFAHALAKLERGEQPGRNAVAREDEPQSNF